MNYKLINRQSLILGKIGSIMSSFFRNKTKFTRVSIYKIKGKKVVTKKHCFKFKDLNYYLLANEASVLSLFSSDKKTRVSGVSVPKLLSIKSDKNYLEIQESFVTGVTFSNLKKDTKISLIKRAQEFMELVDTLYVDKISNSKSQHKNMPFIYLATDFFLSIIKFCIKYPSKLSLAISYYAHFIFLLNKHRKVVENLTVAHGEMYEDSLLYDKNTDMLGIIDWEGLSLKPKWHDLNHLLEENYRAIGKTGFLKVLNNHLLDDVDKEIFLLSGIYQSVTRLSNRPKDKKIQKNSEQYLALLTTMLTRKNTNKNKTLFEKVNPIILKAIYVTCKMMPWLNRKMRPVILGYHSVSNNSWRYSTPSSMLEEHVRTIGPENIHPLSDIVTKKKNGVAFTFDDGYQDVLKNALPIFKKYNIVGTVFILDTKKVVNRAELDNQLPLLSDSEIKILKKEGWEIGFHTSTHPYMRDLSEEQIDQEIRKGKWDLENRLNMKFKYFAYPKGIYNDQIVNAVSKVGFTAAFRADGSVFDGSNEYLYGRVCLEGRTPKEDLIALTSTLGTLYNSFSMFILNIKDSIERKIIKIK